MELDEIIYHVQGGVAEITLNRPERRNALSARPSGTRDQILTALGQAETDEEVGAVVLRGAGPAFSAGGDLTGNVVRTTALEHRRFLEDTEWFHDRVRATAVPIVAAVHGYCLGAALSLVACCDLVVAADTATFGLPEGRLGLVGVSALVGVVGRQWAKYLILTGESIDARRAADIGLVLTVEADDELFERARDLGQRLARLPREAALLNKRTVDTVADASGEAVGRLAAIGTDAVTLSHSALATAPDGRTFRDIIAAEGMAGLRAARADQYGDPWLR